MLQLLRFLIKRTDDLESQLQQQAARTMRDQAATLSVLETQGLAVNAVSARLGATTGQVSPLTRSRSRSRSRSLHLNLTIARSPGLSLTPTLTLTLT